MKLIDLIDGREFEIKPENFKAAIGNNAQSMQWDETSEFKPGDMDEAVKNINGITIETNDAVPEGKYIPLLGSWFMHSKTWEKIKTQGTKKC